MTLDNKYFKPISTSENGDTDDSTVFQYHQTGDIVWATYTGNKIRFGTLLGTFVGNKKFSFNYQQIDTNNIIKTGKCVSDILVLPDGRLKINENWEWTCTNFSKGKSSLIEIEN